MKMSKEFYLVAKIGGYFKVPSYEFYSYFPEKGLTKKIFSSKKINEFEKYLKDNKENFGKKVFVLRGFPNRENIEEILKE